MCGIHGLLGRDQRVIAQMVSAASNRGPNGVGVYADAWVSLGQNLLSIADVPDNSRQPWLLEDRDEVLCFNGQVYNYADLGAGLGEPLMTNCDTEVLAKGLSQHGASFLTHVQGMYALAFYSARTKRILLARDSAGAKPLYYREGRGRLTFSSELRSVLSTEHSLAIDPLALTLYFELGYVPGPRTMIRGLSKLTPGEWREYDAASGELVASGHVGREAPQPVEYHPRALRERVRDGVKQCGQGLRPMGLYLSGGLDSAAILHEAHALGIDLRTYSTRFVGDGLEAFNQDADLARRLAHDYGYSHQDVAIQAGDFANAVVASTDVIEEPRYNRSTPAYYLTAKALSLDGVVVTLSGDGGDEMMAGYPKYATFKQMEEAGLFARTKPRRAAALAQLQAHKRWRWAVPDDLDLRRPVHRWYYLSKFKLEERGLTRGPADGGASNPEILAYLEAAFGGVAHGEDKLNDHLALDQNTWLPEDALIRNDKLGMAFNMEGRFPLLTGGFRDYAMGIASDVKLERGKLKRSMRLAYKRHLPDYITQRSSKTGWAAPVLSWQRDDGAFSEQFDRVLAGSDSLISDMLDLEGVRESREPKLQYAAYYLLKWAKRLNITA